MRTAPAAPDGRSTAGTDRWRQWWTGIADAHIGLPLVIALVQVAGTFGAAHNQPERRPIDVVAFLLLLAGPAALVFRRRHPVAVLWSVMVVSLAYILLGYPYGPFFLSTVVALVVAVRSGHRLAAWLAAAAIYAGHIALGQLLGVLPAPGPVQASIVAGWMLVVLIGAELLRIRHERVQQSRRAAAAESAGRVTEERLRIARELHDVVAHNISLINVQAGVALHLMDAQPEQARTALTAIKQASKEALVELRSVLGLLRQVDEPGPRHPAPSLDRLDELADRTRQAGLDVSVEVVGDARPLPSSVDVAAYRIIQEALTNTLRHARARSVRVRAEYAEGLLIVEVVDDGTPATATPQPVGEAPGVGGAGIAGMRERVTALGGALEVGPLPGQGFRVQAELPTEGTA